jgi:hypothetical protein
MADDDDLEDALGLHAEPDGDEDENGEEIIDTPDGGAIIRSTGPAPAESAFYDNLAEDTPEPELKRMATQLLELIDHDKEARKKRDEQYEEGIRRTGLGEDAPGGAQFQGATKVVHPMLTEACVDFAARSMKEIFPPGGPVKDSIAGQVTEAKLLKAKRKTALLNWQLTVQCPEVRSELEQLMTQVPLGGAQYLKVNWSKGKNRPLFLFVAIDDMYLPFAATNFYSAQRKTHVQFLTQLDYETRVKDGMYRDVDLVPNSMEPDQSKSGVASDRVEGREETSYNEDGLRKVFECHCIIDLAFDEDVDGAAPYIVTIDDSTGDVLAVYRNWEEDDEQREELQWFVEWPFIPWRGAYPIGLPHMIGGLSGAATGALRALLDSAHINNIPSMMKLKGSVGGQSVTIQPTEILELEGSFNVDDIRKLAMPLPFNPPSQTLFQLLGFLVDAGKGVVRTSMEDIADSDANAPVGTTLAKIEQGMVVYSSIHQRLHDAMARMLRILHRLNGQNLDEAKLKQEAGELLATRADFQGPLDVVPVSDPNIFSETQRFAQTQAVAERAKEHPELYNARKVEERVLATLKIPDAKELLNPPLEPKEQNAVNENVAASLGRPITAFPDQDHIAHLKTHLAFLMSPIFGSNKLIAPAFIPVMMGHVREHIVLWYAAGVFEAVNEALGEDIGDIMRTLGHDPESRKAMDGMLAEAGLLVVMDGTEVFQAVPPIMAQAEQLLQSMQPPPPPDPLVAIEQQKIQQKGQSDQQKLAQSAQSDQQKLAQQAQKDQQDTQLKAQAEQQRLALAAQAQQAEAEQARGSLAVQVEGLRSRAMIEQQQQLAEDRRKQEELAAQEAMNHEDNMTAITVAEINQSGKMPPPEVLNE